MLKTMETNEFRFKIIGAYNNLIDRTTAEMACEEHVIIERPNLGTVRDGGKGYYCKELRNLLATLLTRYYSTENLDAWKEFKWMLQGRLSDELDTKKPGRNTTEIIAKGWAVNSVLKSIDYIEKIYLEQKSET